MKDMKRSDWSRCLRRDYIDEDITVHGFPGKVSLTVLRELTAPLTIHYPFGDVKIADTDYSWLQIAVKDQFYWFTAMYDAAGKLKEIYIDITDGNCFDDPDNPCFEDMYLDIVIAGEQLMILDQDELDDALAAGDISQAEYDHSELVCQKLFAYLQEHKSHIIEQCNTYYNALKSKLP